jgi:ankyrin repeat protein
MLIVLQKEAAAMVDPQQVFSDPKVIALARAAAAGKSAEVEGLLHGGVNVKTVGQKGFTVTHFALLAKENAPGILRLLLKAGADPISRLEDGYDVPYYAAARDNADPAVVAALLDAGVSPSQLVGIQHVSWLQAAIGGHNGPVIHLLLDRGADVNFNHPFDGSALHTAMLLPDYDVVVLLLDHGANPHLRNNQAPEIGADVPRRTPAEFYCRFQSGKRIHPTPQQLAGFEAMKQAFAKRGVIIPCGF